MDIENMRFSVRTYLCLKRAGIDTMEQLQTKSEDDLWRIRGLGKKTLEEIKAVLAKEQGRTSEEVK